MNTLVEEKQDLRKKLQQIARMVTPEQKIYQDVHISSLLLKHKFYKKACTIAFFSPLPDEPQIWPVIMDAWDKGKHVTLPSVEKNRLVFRRVFSKKDLEKGMYGILEPNRTKPMVTVSSLDLVIVPGCAFDKKGNRLGRGKGYYDRFLKTMQKPIIGVCYTFRFVDTLPHGRHDRNVDGVITGETYKETPYIKLGREDFKCKRIV